jgi:hypothetical protein
MAPTDLAARLGETACRSGRNRDPRAVAPSPSGIEKAGRPDIVVEVLRTCGIAGAFFRRVDVVGSVRASNL